MQLRFPCFLSPYFLGVFSICIFSLENYGNIHVMQLQFFSFSELNLHNYFGADSNCFQAILKNLSESLGVHKILVRQIWFNPPPLPREKGPK